MSTTFKEFLQQQAKKHQEEVDKGKTTVDEWRVAVEKLFEKIRKWIKESDSEGLIEIREGQQEIKEPGLGHYRVPRLDLNAFGKWIGIIPKARKTVGTATPPLHSAPQRAEGRVDITDELRRFVLYRFRDTGGDTWMIEGLDIGGHDEIQDNSLRVARYIRRSEPITLTQEAFEKALMSYFQ